MNRTDEYDYRVIWSESDSVYIATVAEFPSLSYIDVGQTAALAGIVDLVGFILKDMESNSGEAPTT
ncbi:MAG: antitoxin HicB [Coriobacteriia bacterium]|nr:antitoxin HicB [Coriobacteriia bacterium]